MIMLRNPKPTSYRVLVKLKKVEEKVSAGGIALPGQATKRHQSAAQEAYVIAIGPTAFESEEEHCKAGDLVLIPKYAGDDIEGVEEDEIYRIVDDTAVKAVFIGEEFNKA